MKCLNDEKQTANLLNTGKLLLLKDKTLFEPHSIRLEISNIDESDLPEFVDSSAILREIVSAAEAKSFRRLLTQFHKDGGKMRKINKNSCQMVHQLICQEVYIQ